MNPYASPQAYRASSVMTASPGQLVVMLYDGAGRFLRQAEIAAEEGAWRHALDRLDKADAIVDELLVTLNTEQGGDLAERLQGIYVFCKRLMIEVRVERDVEKIRKTASLLADLREAWAEIATA
ncbi:MAG TPA: flagellar export chaperone FliS [Solirubrobacteraceae bacterium]|nr:flagellar export chaperone FliS [Solirubrobacteraceae bacterium]